MINTKLAQHKISPSQNAVQHIIIIIIIIIFIIIVIMVLIVNGFLICEFGAVFKITHSGIIKTTYKHMITVFK